MPKTKEEKACIYESKKNSSRDEKNVQNGKKEDGFIPIKKQKDSEILHLQENMILLGSINPFKVTIFLAINLGLILLIVQLDKE